MVTADCPTTLLSRLPESDWAVIEHLWELFGAQHFVRRCGGRWTVEFRHEREFQISAVFQRKREAVASAEGILRAEDDRRRSRG